jgi:adenosine deaminase
VCITSNHQTGVIGAVHQHPLPRMLQEGLKVTINTDDPGISRITLTDEYRVALEELGMPVSMFKETVLNAARASFLPPEERQSLVEMLEPELNRALQWL